MEPAIKSYNLDNIVENVLEIWCAIVCSIEWYDSQVDCFSLFSIICRTWRRFTW